MESILNEVETFPAFLKMNSTTDIYSKFSKIFRATISRGCFCLNVLQEITVYWCNWFYFPVRSIWHLKEWFSGKCLVRRGTRTPCTACLKRILFHCTIIHIASVDCVQAEDRLHETLSIYLYHKTPSFTNIYIIYYNKYIIYIYIKQNTDTEQETRIWVTEVHRLLNFWLIKRINIINVYCLNVTCPPRHHIRHNHVRLHILDIQKSKECSSYN